MSAMKIHGSEKTIGKVFSDDFAFEIPHYQRPYSWTPEHAGELWDDLAATLVDHDAVAIDEIPPYFLGCIVLIKADGSPDAKVVDGQQRLTILTILLSALRETIDDRSVAEGLTEFLYAKGNPVVGTTDRFRLLTRDRDREFFQKYVQKQGALPQLVKIDKAHLDSTSKLHFWANGLLLFDRARRLTEAQRRRLATFILTRCVLVVVSSPDLDSAYRIFSILNNRGLDLSHTDILKAEIVGQLPPDLSEEYSEKWEDAENDLGIEAFKDLFAHIRMIYRKQKMRETVLKEFRDYVVPHHEPRELVDSVIIPMSESYQEIAKQAYTSTSGAEEINQYFGWLRQIDNFDWMPPAIKIVTDHKDDSKALTRFIRDLERLAASMMINRVNITKRIERYGRVLTAIERGDDLYGASSPLQLSADECASTLTALDGPIYLERNVPRYVLLRLDALLSDGEASYDHEIISIEHVLPQDPLDDSEWCSNIPDANEREALVHRVGNLVLLSRRKNSSARNFDFEKKKTKYFTKNGKGSPFVLTSQVLGERVWTADVIRRRQSELVGHLKKLWRLA